ncbi:MAG TPA: C4-dicarboxylate ABC transporter substrate-binding protein [Synergistaceae bacterium]|jgi:tripartite ATP-independent transporter DctP family solute receptor|nr:C4-dicarboxylate ABC transporter substrate-binding protein [Synergistaceae bacterium]
MRQTALALAVFFCVVLAAAGVAGAEQYVLKIGSITNETHPYYVAFQKVFVPYIEKEAQGRIKVEFYFNAQLGGDREMVEMCQFGALSMDCATPSTLSGFDKRFQVLGLPYLFPDKATAFKALDGELGKTLDSYLPAINLYNLGYFENGFRHVTNNKKPIHSIQDMEGLKIRTQENPMHISFFRSIGANPTPINWGELYTALQQKTVDAQENPLVLIYEAKLYEVQKYVSLTGHVYEPTMLVTSKVWFDTLPEDLQKVVREAARLFCDEERRLIDEEEKSARAMLEEHGMQVNDLAPEQLAVFVERSRKLYDDSRGLLGDEVVDLAIKATKKD